MSAQEIRTAADQDDGTAGKVICKLCHRQFAKYTCPICNIPYCALTCFRSPSHSQCSETFYKNQLESDIATNPSRTNSERSQMLDLLKRFEEEAAVDEDALKQEAFGDSDDENGEENSLIKRFAGLDIKTLSSGDIWQMLTPAERKKFTAALENPTSDLARALLGSEYLEAELERPWFLEDESEGQDDRQASVNSWPELVRIPQSMIKPVPHGQPLIYNLCAICITYSYIVRRLGVRMLSTLSPANPDFEETSTLMDHLLPFLSDRRSTTLHPSVGAATKDVYSRLGIADATPEQLALLLEDAATLLRPRRVISIPSQSSEHGSTDFFDASTHPLAMPIYVLSDMIGFHRLRSSNTTKRDQLQEDQQQPPQAQRPGSLVPRAYQHVIRKLEYYIAHIAATPTSIMEGVSGEVVRWVIEIRMGKARLVMKILPSGSMASSQGIYSGIDLHIRPTRNLCSPSCTSSAKMDMSSLLHVDRRFFFPRDDDEVACGSGGGDDRFLGLRIASIFIVLACSSFGATFPIIAKNTACLHLPKSAFDFAKYFGSGVIIATAFIHLLDPAIEELGSPCLSDAWGEYPYAIALALLSIFLTFIVELIAFQWGSAILAKAGKNDDQHEHNTGVEYVAREPESEGSIVTGSPRPKDETKASVDLESLDGRKDGVANSPLSQILGVAILEVGIAVLIGLTLAVDPDFKILFIVIVFHQMFEGLGVGSRLAQLKIDDKYNWVRYAGAALYGITTPVGIAAGLGVRTTYNPGTAKASIVSGVLDSLSAGILIYTGLVELLAHEILLNKEMMEGSKGQLAYCIIVMLFGTGIMALLGRWA
ncbi:hypothetical protein AGABI2DRAFT_118644 [Agaricus bisporus var. bisporus H97]|uniref:hypothetical protein n=1 Tax=Agaricus bisporus var. bisporus (strain H97 / ATCC MYA-4626 / FGSC 10389) TaxID=936046 RepID=UPI00029F798A|nr:hypothetical protein AGABI2DRAFT_118644 [Agaricus bisporus var. bisporus H97]EKV46464.1 hypothetical protein AGABI2DRAFT_118644 [Agaricus bisporus var. bisporus H97]